MSKRVKFTLVAYFIASLAVSYMNIEGAAYFFALIGIIILSYIIHPSKGTEEEEVYPGRDPREG